MLVVLLNSKLEQAELDEVAEEMIEKKGQQDENFDSSMLNRFCVVCFDNKTEEILECNHSFCSNCINTWYIFKKIE